MSKKNSLPDSLELLLDTMCNTFGGIMFIAISLIIISSMVTKNIISLLPEEIDASAIQRVEEETAQLRQEIEELKQKENTLLQEQVKHVSPERLAAVKDIVDLKQKNTEMEMRKKQQETELQATRQKNADAQKQFQEQQQKNVAEEKQSEMQKEKLQKILAEERVSYEKLKKEYETYVPKQITFSMEEGTERDPYFVLLDNGKLYHMGTNREICTDEVTEVTTMLPNVIRFTPRSGKGISIRENSDAKLRSFFRDISPQNHFIFFSVGKNSFSEFCIVKQYLREKGYQLFWDYNPDFIFSRGNASYKASQ